MPSSPVLLQYIYIYLVSGYACYYCCMPSSSVLLHPRVGRLSIIESVDSICRDGADTPISLNKSNGSELPNADVLSLFRQTTCSASASIHFNTLKVRKIYSYSDSRKFVKTRIVHHLLLLLLLLLSNSVQTAYRETGVSNRSNSFTKIIYTGAYMILDAQNLHTFSQNRQTPGLQPYKC